MNGEMLLSLAFVSLALTALTATSIRALREFSLKQLEEISRRRGSTLGQTEILRHYDSVAIAVESLGTLAVGTFVGAISFWTYFQWRQDQTAAWYFPPVCVVVSALALIMCEVWIPWAVARLWAAPFVFHTWRLWRGLSIVLFPLVLCARLVDVVLHRLSGRPQRLRSEDMIEDEIRTIVTEGHREGLLEEEAREMIVKVMELRDLDVSKAMTPRTDIVMIRLGMPWTEVIDFVNESGHTRIPVYDKSRDNVVGILHAKDLLGVLARAADRPLPEFTSILRRPYFVPETKRLDDLLEEFQKTRNHIALVLDEYGGLSGLVTIEDVLEQIVGEIADEYDEDVVEPMTEIDSRTTETSARMHLDEINERLGISLPEDGDFDTIGGFVFHALGRIPNPGDEVVHDGVRIQVVEATRRKIEKVRIILPEPRREAV